MDMKAKSGILLVREGGLNQDGVSIHFDPFPGNDEPVDGGRGQVVMRHRREVGGTGAFAENPAYMASIHEYFLEDSRRGRGRQEIDSIQLDPVATKDKFDISWKMSDAEARAVEIGFLAIGE